MARPSIEDLEHPGYSENRGLLRIFFDTEFTGLITDPKLISIGLVDETGERTFYAELSDTWQDAEVRDEFVRAAVLPQLQGGTARMTMDELALRLENWFADFAVPVKLATDSLSWDWPWMQEIFYDRTWPANVDGKPLLLTMNYLNHFDAFNDAIEKAFVGGLRRHHALDDAKAHRLGWIAAGGDIDR